MNYRVVLSIVFIALGFIIAAVPNNTTLQFKLTPEEMLADLNSRSQYISPDEVAEMIISQDPSIQLIDLRSSEEYNKFHLPGAYNIPLTELLNDEYRYVINQDLKLNVFYSNGTVIADEAYIITRQMGYYNNYVLEGGLNYWAETIMNPEKPAITSPNDELARYDFRIGAGQALGGGSALSSDTKAVAPPPVQSRPKKQKAQGGC
ncbi:MAG: rhodanese-like domain-containing protein [Marinilabiliaceae bacterium]|jgi:rhodanese-related sulfurtransferase|nr:rhodanese-like domain-containing protein [Marinilabiliaceae bacterium]